MTLPAPALQENTPETADLAVRVHQALDFMRSPQGDPAHTTLYELELVKRITVRLKSLPATGCHQHALDCLLVAFISGGLTHHRRMMGLPPPSGVETRRQALNTLARDARCGGRELLSWGLLYYRYVRVDLDLNDAQIGRIVNLDTRSLRRYRQLGITRLADWLFRAELHLCARNMSDPVLAALLTHDALDRIIDLEVLVEPRSPAACFHPHLVDRDVG